MIHTSRRGFLAGTVCVAALPAIAQAQTRDVLAAEFATPPDSAKPRVWWHWMNGNVTREGIAKDLAWMKRVGIGGVQNFDAARRTPQVVENRLVYMTPEWQETFRFAARRAEELDIELAIASSPGWSETGGPWVEPRNAMKKLVWSETILEGGEHYQDVLPTPPNTTGPFQDVPFVETNSVAPDIGPLPVYYADALVLAYPVSSQPVRARALSVNGEALPLDALSGADLTNGIDIPAAQNGEPGAVQYDLGRAQSVSAATVFLSNQVRGTRPATLQYSTNGRTWRDLVGLSLGTVPSTVSFSSVSARYFRVIFQASAASPFGAAAAGGEGGGGSGGGGGFSMPSGIDPSALGAAFIGRPTPPSKFVQFELFAQPRINAFETKAGFSIAHDYFVLDGNVGADAQGLAPDSVLDISQHMSADGRLDWTPPAGRWKVLRLGYSLTGSTNHPASEEATGLEVDKYDAQAVEGYMNTYLDMYRETTGANLMGGRGLRALLTDSTEVGPSNWTPRMLELFENLRGYDAKPWLPALTGEVIGSRSQSDAFLYDFRRTLAELHATEHYGTVARVAHERGLIVYGESLEATRATLGDDLDMRSFADIPMSALWTYNGRPSATYNADGRGAASVAHLRGSTLVACESLTSIAAPYLHAPRDLQPMIDAIFANGVNRPVIHTSVHQPLDRAPGLSLQVFGQFFSRLESWAELAKPWIDYISRNSYMLQQGRNVADVLYFYGEDTPVGAQASDSSLQDAPTRYAYDFISANGLMTLSVENGEIVSAGGARYRAVYLNSKTGRMTLPVLRKLASLAEAGGIIIGEAPEASPSLHDDPAEFAQIVRRLWNGGDAAVGQGRVIPGRDIEAALAQTGLGADFEHSAEAEILFVHRRFEGGDLYFVANRAGEGVQTEARFRVSGMAAELWRADTGASEPVSYRMDGAHTIVPLDLRAHESIFVVFRTPSSQTAVTVTRPDFQQVAALDGSWRVSFQEGRGAPDRISLDALQSLSEHPDTGVKYFSGEATYTKSFDLPEGVRRGDPLLIDLGEIGDIAEVRVNGRLAGSAWKPPYQVDIGPFVRTRRNTLQIRVANLWVNRLIGDQQPDAEQITFTTIGTFTRSAPLRPSGLIGPVTLLAHA